VFHPPAQSVNQEAKIAAPFPAEDEPRAVLPCCKAYRTVRLLEGHVQRTPDRSEPERKTLEVLKSMPQGFIATLDQLADYLAKP
jgi:hypothetical protein